LNTKADRTISHSMIQVLFVVQS